MRLATAGLAIGKYRSVVALDNRFNQVETSVLIGLLLGAFDTEHVIVTEGLALTGAVLRLEVYLTVL